MERHAVEVMGQEQLYTGEDLVTERFASRSTDV